MLKTLLLPTTADLLRVVSGAARRADAGLAAGAARNAASSVAERQARRLDDARTLRDLRRIGVDGTDAAEGRR